MANDIWLLVDCKGTGTQAFYAWLEDACFSYTHEFSNVHDIDFFIPIIHCFGKAKLGLYAIAISDTAKLMIKLMFEKRTGFNNIYVFCSPEN